MDEEMEEMMPPQQNPKIQEAIMQSMMLAASGNALLLLGGLFVMWGIAAFISDYFGIKGVGEFLVGLVLILIALLLFRQSKQVAPKLKVMQAQKRPKPKPEEPSKSYA